MFIHTILPHSGTRQQQSQQRTIPGTEETCLLRKIRVPLRC